MERNQELCARIETELLLFVGGELDPAAVRAVATHLETCSDCRARERSARSTQVARLRALDTVEGPGPDLWPALRAELAREGRFVSASAPRAPALPPRRAASTLWWAAAAALVLFGAWAVRAVVDRGFGAGGDDPREHLVVEPRHTAPRPVVAQPVSTGGLRRVSADELPLEHDALLLGDEPFRPMPVFLLGDERVDLPAGLQRARR